MVNTLNHSIIRLALGLFLLQACTITAPPPPEKAFPEPVVTNIAILPIVTIQESGESFTYSQLKSQERGVEKLTEIVQNYFMEHKNVTLLNNEKVDSFDVVFSANRFAQARAIAANLRADAVMTITLNRFTERDGGKYSVQQPASVAFDYRLMLTENGQTLCSGVFDETQKSLTDNLLSFKSVFKRKLQWITAEELASDGVALEFNDCKYLSIPTTNADTEQ